MKIERESELLSCWFLFFLFLFLLVFVVERREGVGALDEPAEGEEGGAGEDGGAPSVGVPLAVLTDGEPPLLPQGRRIRIRRVRRVRVLEPGSGLDLAAPWIEIGVRRWFGRRRWRWR